MYLRHQSMYLHIGQSYLIFSDEDEEKMLKLAEKLDVHVRNATKNTVEEPTEKKEKKKTEIG